MNMKKKVLLGLVAAGLFALPARPAKAGEFTVYGSYWNTKDAQSGYGGGAKVGWSFFELRGTYFNDVTAKRVPDRFDFKIHAAPIGAGLKFDLTHDTPVTPYLGAGAEYYLLSTNRGSTQDEVGWYGVAGLDFATSPKMGVNVEAIWHDVRGTVKNLTTDDVHIVDRAHLDLSGLGANAGVYWRF
jgi:opacity protein-like surface antigen